MDTIPRKTPGIYQITCLPTGKFYIGSAVSIPQRWATHRRRLCDRKHCNQRLQRAWIKYGADAFTFAVLEVCDINQLREREQLYLDTLRPYIKTIGFNIAICAEAPMRGRKFGSISEEKRQKLSVAAKNRAPMSDATLEIVRRAARSRPPLSPEAEERRKEGYRAWQRNRPPISEETRERMRAAQKGHPVSASAREKMSAAAKARQPRSEAVRKKVGDAMREAHRTGRYKATYPPRHIITTPEGEELLVSFTAFCRDHDLSFNGMMHAVRAGVTYKGYKARRVRG